MLTTFQSMTNYPNPDFPLITTEEDNGSITFEWDPDHPVTCVFNDWGEQDFIDAIMKACRDTLGEEEFEKIKTQTNVS